MLQDPNVERYVEQAIKPLLKQIKELKAEVDLLKKALHKTDVSGSNSTLYSVCCNEEPHHRKKGNVEYYECPYCKEECEVEWMEDELPDYCH